MIQADCPQKQIVSDGHFVGHLGYPSSYWYLIVSIPDLCTLTYLYSNLNKSLMEAINT